MARTSALLQIVQCQHPKERKLTQKRLIFWLVAQLCYRLDANQHKRLLAMGYLAVAVIITTLKGICNGRPCNRCDYSLFSCIAMSDLFCCDNAPFIEVLRLFCRNTFFSFREWLGPCFFLLRLWSKYFIEVALILFCRSPSSFSRFERNTIGIMYER